MISILMPIYNGIEFIDESVGSILNQTFSDWELIIGINGLSENSDVFKKAIEYKSGNVMVLDLFTIKGKANALNEMIKYCKYDYVALLDVDDIWHNKKLEKQVPFIEKYDVVGSRCIYFGDINGVVPYNPVGDISMFDFFRINPIINSSCIIRKELCYWNHEWNGVEDYDLWLKLQKQEKTFYNCSEVLVKHRIHKTSAFNANGNNNFVGDLKMSHLVNIN
jgi:glycosyltransferase involved in cell wall biosynthesis